MSARLKKKFCAVLAGTLKVTVPTSSPLLSTPSTSREL